MGYSAARIVAERAGAPPLRWREIDSHADGQFVTARGRIGSVTLRATSRHDVWAEFELIMAPRGLRVPCLAFPSTYRRLRTALEPGQRRDLLGRISFGPANEPTMHVVAWS